MLTLEENRWNFKAIKIMAALNILLIEIKEEEGKPGFRIQRQSNKLRILLWKTAFCLGILHWIYMAGRLVQSTILEPEEYFRWDHFVIHFTVVVAYAVFYFLASRLFCVNCEELGLVFNHLFVQQPRPVPLALELALEQIKDEEHQINDKLDNDNKTIQGKTRGKFWSRIEVKSTSGKGQDQGQGQSPGQGQGQGEDQDQGEVRPILAWPMQRINVKGNVNIKLDKKASQGQGQGQNQGQDQGQGQSEGQPRIRSLFAWPLQYSLDELLARTFAILVVLTDLFTVVIFAVDPSQSQLLYSALPSDYQNPWSFLTLLAVEVVFLVATSSCFCLSVIVQLLFFNKCQLEFGRLQAQLRILRENFQSRPFGQRNIGGEIRILRQISKEMRQLVVFIELFNRCFPLVIFAWKICAFFLLVLFYFFALRYYQEFPLLAVIAIYLAIVVTLLYTLTYGHAFSIPGKMDDLKREFLLAAQKTEESSASTATPTTSMVNSTNKLQLIVNSRVTAGFRQEMKRKIGGIRNVGVKVGGFRTIERGSTPDFVDFVLNQVVSLLVAFP